MILSGFENNLYLLPNMEMSPSSPTKNQMQQQEVSRLLTSIQQVKKHLKMVYGEDHFAQLKMNTEGDIDAAATRLSLILQMLKLAKQRTMLGKLALRENSVNVNDQQQQYQQYPQHQILNQQPKQLNTMPKSSSYNHERLELQPAASPQVQPNTIEHQQQQQQHPHHEILNQQQKFSHMVPMPNLSSYNHQLQGHVDIQSATSPQVQQITMEQQQQMQSHLRKQLKQQHYPQPQQHPQPQKQQMRQQHPHVQQHLIRQQHTQLQQQQLLQQHVQPQKHQKQHPQPQQQQTLQQHVQPQKHQNQQHPQPQQQQILQQHSQTQQQLKRKQHPQPRQRHPQPEQQQILQQHPQTQQQLKQQHPQPQQLLKLQQHSHPQQQFKRQQHPQTQQQQIRQQYPHPQQLQKQQQHPQLWRPTNNSSSYNYQRQTHVDPQSAASLQIQQNTMERQQQQQQQQHPQPVISVPNSSSYNYQRQQQVDLHSAALPQVQENTMGQQQMQSQLQNRIVFKRIPLCSSPDFIAYERVTPGECSSQGNVATNQSLGKRKDHNFISQNVQDQVVSERLYINPQLAAMTQNEQLVMRQKQADLQQQQTDLQQLFVTSPKVQKNTMDFNLQEFSEPVQQQHRENTQQQQQHRQQQQEQQHKESSMMQMLTFQRTMCLTESQHDATATITGGISCHDYDVTNQFLGKRKNQDFVSQNLQAQEISKELHINPQVSVLTRNEQPVMMQNSLEKQPLIKQISEVSLPNTSSLQRRQHQQHTDFQQQPATSPQLEDDTMDNNLQEFCELLEQQLSDQQQHATSPQLEDDTMDNNLQEFCELLEQQLLPL